MLCMLLSTLSCNQKTTRHTLLTYRFCTCPPPPPPNPLSHRLFAWRAGQQAQSRERASPLAHNASEAVHIIADIQLPSATCFVQAHRRAQHPLACESSPPRRVSYRSSRRCRRLRRALHNYSTLVSLPRSPEPVGPRQSGRRHRLSRVPPAAATLPYGGSVVRFRNSRFRAPVASGRLP